MGLHGWDASNHDWGRGPMNLALARQQGISLFTHKAGEGNGFYEDPYFGEAMARAHAAGFPVIGAYFVNHPGDPIPQADWFVDLVNRYAPWWRQVTFLWQLDAEKFDYMPRPPSIAECNAFNDRVVARSGCSPKAIGNYAPEWLYGAAVGGLKHRNWWASNYGANPAGDFRSIAPGDGDGRWSPVGGLTPVLLQHSSQATIAGQAPADANVIRVANESQLHTLLGGSGDDMSAAELATLRSDIAALKAAIPTADVIGARVWTWPFAPGGKPLDTSAHVLIRAFNSAVAADTKTSTIQAATDTLEASQSAQMSALTALATQLGLIPTKDDVKTIITDALGASSPLSDAQVTLLADAVSSKITVKPVGLTGTIDLAPKVATP